MGNWLDLNTWNMLLKQLETWWFAEVMVSSNLIQLTLIGSVFVIAKLFSPHLRRLLKRWRESSSPIPAIRRVFDALDTITITLAWLAMQWLAILAAKAAALPHTLLITTYACSNVARCNVVCKFASGLH